MILNHAYWLCFPFQDLMSFVDIMKLTQIVISLINFQIQTKSSLFIPALLITVDFTL